MINITHIQGVIAFDGIGKLGNAAPKPSPRKKSPAENFPLILVLLISSIKICCLVYLLLVLFVILRVVYFVHWVA